MTEAVSVTKARIRIGAPQCGQTRGNTSSILASSIAHKEAAYERCTVAAACSAELPGGRHGAASEGACAAVPVAIAVACAHPGAFGASTP